MIKHTFPAKLLYAAAAVLLLMLCAKNIAALCTAILPRLFAGSSIWKPAALAAGVLAVVIAGLLLLRLAARADERAHDEKPVRLDYLILFALAYCLRAAWTAFVMQPPYSDYEIFYWVTHQIALFPEPSYLQDPYFHTWAYQTGFPALLAPLAFLFPGQYEPFLFTNCLFEAGTVLCIFKLLTRFHKRNTAFALACLYLSVPLPYMLAPVLTNQLSATFFTMLGVCVFFGKPDGSITRACAAGLLLAIGNALRAEGILMLAAFAALAVLRLLSPQPIKSRIQKALPAAACCAVYLACGLLFSNLFVWTGLNPNGLRNEYPLYKFAVGLNEKTRGQYNAEEANALLALPEKTRDEATKAIIAEQLSVGPLRLLSLFWNKADIQWTDRAPQYPAFTAQANDSFVNFPGFNLSVGLLENVTAFMQSICWSLLFGFAAIYAALSAATRDGTPFAMFLYIFAAVTIAAFALIEVQTRYAYALLPALFLSASFGGGTVLRVIKKRLSR